MVSIAGVSRKTFYELFEDRNDCLLAAVKRSVTLAIEAARGPYESDGRWLDRTRGGLLALLEFFDSEPQLARLCVVQLVAPEPALIAYRTATLARLAATLDEGRAEARRQPPPLTAEVLVGGILTTIHSRLLSPDPEALSTLINQLMSFLALPYMGAKTAEMELSRPLPAPATVMQPERLEGLNMRLTYRTMRVLSVIAAQPGLSNKDVAINAGIADQGQISKLLARLTQLELVANTGKGRANGAPNAWELTPRGHKMEQALKRASIRGDGRQSEGSGSSCQPTPNM